MEDLWKENIIRLSSGLIEKLKENSEKKNLKAGHILLTENSYTDAIPFISKGVIKVVRKMEGGKEIILYYIKEGEVCVFPFFANSYYRTSKLMVKVEKDAEIYFLPIHKVKNFIRESTQWLDYIFVLHIDHYEKLFKIIETVMLKKIDERLLDLLKYKSEVFRSKIILNTHEELANELLSARVVVSRSLKKLEQKGVIKLGRNEIVLI